MQGNELQISFEDLSVSSGLVEEGDHQYEMKIEAEHHAFAVDTTNANSTLAIRLSDEIIKNDVLELTLRTLGKEPAGDGKIVTVYVELKKGNSRIVGVEREE